MKIKNNSKRRRIARAKARPSKQIEIDGRGKDSAGKLYGREVRKSALHGKHFAGIIRLH